MPDCIVAVADGSRVSGSRVTAGIVVAVGLRVARVSGTGAGVTVKVARLVWVTPTVAVTAAVTPAVTVAVGVSVGLAVAVSVAVSVAVAVSVTSGEAGGVACDASTALSAVVSTRASVATTSPPAVGSRARGAGDGVLAAASMVEVASESWVTDAGVGKSNVTGSPATVQTMTAASITTNTSVISHAATRARFVCTWVLLI